MSAPKIEVMCISNVFTRMMHFEKIGDVEIGHRHTYDHGTLLSKGSVLYEVLESKDGKTRASKIFHAPSLIYVNKNDFHRITALEDDTVCACIHAIRTNDEELIPPDSFIETFIHTKEKNYQHSVHEITGKLIKSFTIVPDHDCDSTSNVTNN